MNDQSFQNMGNRKENKIVLNLERGEIKENNGSSSVYSNHLTVN